jgi:hypothetical protein
MASILTSILEIHGLSLGARTVLLGLLSFRNKTSGQCNPNIQTLADRLKTAKRTVERRLQELQRTGILVAKRHLWGNSYVFHLPRAVENPRSRPVENSGFQDASNVSISANSGGSVSANSGGSVSANSGGSEAPPPYMNRQMLNRQRGKRAPLRKTTEVVGLAQPVENRSLFPLFFKCFVNAGVPLNGRDEADARKVFESYPQEEQERIGKWVIAQLQGPWRSAEFTPTPIRALRSEGWTRVAAERIVRKPPTREERLIEAIERRRAEQAGRRA